MRKRGPDVLLTCSVCCMVTRCTTTVKFVQVPGDEHPSQQIIAPLIMHAGDGGHMTLHPAMALEDMSSDTA